MRRYLAYSVIVIASFAVAFYFKPSRPLEFDSVSDAKERIERAGFNCIYTHEQSGRVLVVSDHPISLDEARTFEVERMSSNTKGMIAVMPKTAFESSSGQWKLWGETSVTGDTNFLSRIENIIK